MKSAAWASFQSAAELPDCDDECPETGWDMTKASRAVVCNNGKQGILLYYVGAAISGEVEEAGLWHLDELGLDDAPVGITIWEGDYRFDGTDNTYPEGAFRSLTPDEWASVQAGREPWNRADWMAKSEGER